MDERETFIRSEQTLAAVIERIRDDRWDEVSPAWFQSHRGASTLRQIVGYHTYDSAWVPDVLAGRTIEEVGNVYDGELLGADPIGAHRHHSARAIAAARDLEDLDRTVHLSYGDFPAREYLKHVTSFRGLRAYDIAFWIGAPAELPADLVRGMWDEIAPSVEEWRALGVYGPAVSVPEDAPLQDRLLGLCGRNPRGPW